MIGERLLDLRKDAELTQKQLSKILNITNHSISAYERDVCEPPDEIKLKIAKFFNVSMDYLVGLTDKPNAYIKQERYLVLPKEFPDEAREELSDYAKYLVLKNYKNKNKKRTKDNHENEEAEVNDLGNKESN